jgi:mannose-6-phosphate isomerase-like protein (cupin superfamily)
MHYIRKQLLQPAKQSKMARLALRRKRPCFRMTSITSLKKLIDENSNERYFNTVLETVNDQVVRLSIMTEPYPWHSHPNSDETFIGVDGTVVIETPNDRFELTPATTITIRKGVLH